MTMNALTIDMILPHKERFTAANAGAVSTVVRDLVITQNDNAHYRIFGTPVKDPLLSKEFHPA